MQGIKKTPRLKEKSKWETDLGFHLGFTNQILLKAYLETDT